MTIVKSQKFLPLNLEKIVHFLVNEILKHHFIPWWNPRRWIQAQNKPKIIDHKAIIVIVIFFQVLSIRIRIKLENKLSFPSTKRKKRIPRSAVAHYNSFLPSTRNFKWGLVTYEVPSTLLHPSKWTQQIEGRGGGGEGNLPFGGSGWVGTPKNLPYGDCCWVGSPYSIGDCFYQISVVGRPNCSQYATPQLLRSRCLVSSSNAHSPPPTGNRQVGNYGTR